LQMDESTQQNAAMVEEASAAAGSMNDQAVRLTQLTAFFRLAESGNLETRAGTQTAERSIAADSAADGREVARSGPRHRALRAASAHRMEAAGPSGTRRPMVARSVSSPGPLAPPQERLDAAAGADWDEF